MFYRCVAVSYLSGRHSIAKSTHSCPACRMTGQPADNWCLTACHSPSASTSETSSFLHRCIRHLALIAYSLSTPHHRGHFQHKLQLRLVEPIPAWPTAGLGFSPDCQMISVVAARQQCSNPRRHGMVRRLSTTRLSGSSRASGGRMLPAFFSRPVCCRSCLDSNEKKTTIVN